MELNQIIRDIEEVDKVEKVTEVIEDIEEIAQRLASLYVSMKILATHCGAIKTLSTDEYKSLKITEEELWKYWDKVLNGEKLHMLTEDTALHLSEELDFLICVALEDVKEALQNINRVSNDII